MMLSGNLLIEEALKLYNNKLLEELEIIHNLNYQGNLDETVIIVQHAINLVQDELLKE